MSPTAYFVPGAHALAVPDGGVVVADGVVVVVGGVVVVGVELVVLDG
ncbi:hypothetical protein [Mycobacterium simulans]|nr:hypothetical protein [Mycobacterium simulans]